MIKKYRKKPVVIEAVQWTGDNRKEVLAFMNKSEEFSRTTGKGLFIDSLEGLTTASPGDFIIKGVKGEFYPCKPDIFEATYEEA